VEPWAGVPEGEGIPQRGICWDNVARDFVFGGGLFSSLPTGKALTRFYLVVSSALVLFVVFSSFYPHLIALALGR
jgi:hypothetical protein